MVVCWSHLILQSVFRDFTLAAARIHTTEIGQSYKAAAPPPQEPTVNHFPAYCSSNLSHNDVCHPQDILRPFSSG